MRLYQKRFQFFALWFFFFYVTYKSFRYSWLHQFYWYWWSLGFQCFFTYLNNQKFFTLVSWICISWNFYIHFWTRNTPLFASIALLCPLSHRKNSHCSRLAEVFLFFITCLLLSIFFFIEDTTACCIVLIKV